MSRSAFFTIRKQRMLPYYGRGLERMNFFLGSIKPYIENARNTIEILVIGIRYGQVLLDLHLEFGAKVELHGININEGNGTSETAVRVGKFLGKINSNKYVLNNCAQIISHDARLGLPYFDGYFDLILNQ